MLARLRSHQIRVFGLTWLGYAAYYLTRKNYSAVKTDLNEGLGISLGALGNLDASNKIAYALGQFVHGVLGDRIGGRRTMALGLIGSAVCAAAFGASSALWVFALVWTVNGFFQAAGWPGGVKAMTPWFGRESRGKVMGLWCTNYQVGGLVASLLAGYLVVHVHGPFVGAEWRAAFFVPAVLVTLMGGALVLFLTERPEQVGLTPLHQNQVEAAESAPKVRLSTLLQNPAIWAMGTAYFGLKLIRYSLLDWLPYYLHKHLHYPRGMDVYLSVTFELGGIVGAIALGWISDRYFPRSRLRLAAVSILLLAVAVLFYRATGHLGLLLNALGMALIGMLLFGPDTLIAGAASQDIGGDQAASSVAGTINGIGSFGAAVAGPLTPRLAEAYGWGAVFLFFIATALVAGLALLWLAVVRRL